MNNENKKCIDNTVDNTKKNIKNITRTIRVNEEQWNTFKNIAYSRNYSANELINLFIESINMGRSQIADKSTTNIININIPIQQQAQQVKQEMDIKEYITEKEFDYWLNQAEKQVLEKGDTAPMVRNRIIKMASRLKKTNPETLKKIKKLTEFWWEK